MTNCSHSIAKRLSRRLALFTALVIGLLSAASWFSMSMMIHNRNTEDLRGRCDLFAEVLELEARRGGEAAVIDRLRSDALMRGASRVEVRAADGRMIHADVMTPLFSKSTHVQQRDFTIPAPDMPGKELQVRYAVDYAADAAMGTRWAWTLALVTIAAGVAVWLGTGWRVRQGLRPLHDLAAQTRAISPQHLDQRLALVDPAEELLPWIDQFNALMTRLELSYAQLEGFNADVAHELRTPLATLIGQTEVELARPRDAESLRNTLASNLEEMQRLSVMVNDMLFLSNADRGAQARRGEPVSLAALAQQVVEFHEAPLEDAGLLLRVEGDATVPVDEPLFKRALSNLVSNATRYAERGSTVILRIGAEPENAADGPVDPASTATRHIQVVVQNNGPVIAAQELPKLFDRFFRGDSSRACPDEQHHGLGLAIVAAIARMHAGRTVAESAAGVTRVGFTLAAG
jgi:two-component system, OmpR family, heavy metal sensor histidine kinase CusS